jgi:hypothetical protein
LVLVERLILALQILRQAVVAVEPLDILEEVETLVVAAGR